MDWLDGKFPLTIETVKEMVVDRCDLPDGFHVDDYVFFQGIPTIVLNDHDVIDIGGREIEVLHTPGHSPGHLCFWEKDKGYLFTGDLVYKDTLFAYYPSTDPEAYLASLEMEPFKMPLHGQKPKQRHFLISASSCSRANPYMPEFSS